ncbi:MAG TPA: methyltransferase domain-containing protein [Usitatibacter sp.]|nr:methyltransferase domain-containing protein [Usitatibacter sp.]
MGNAHTTFGGSIPEYYDRCLGPAQFDPFGRELAALVPRDTGGDVLEIACGTGLVTRRLRERLDPARRLVASDLSPAMLDYARKSLAGIQGIEWREADATSLPFRDGEFAAVVCALGFMFVPDKPAAFREARRVLAHGGRIYFSVWDRMEENIAAMVSAQAIERIFPDDAEIRFRLPWSMHDETMLRKLLADARFEVVSIQKRRLPILGDPRTLATGGVRGTPRGALLEQRGLSMDEAIERVTVALQDAGPLHGQVILVEARA